MADVFISYARTSSDRARSVAEALRSLGYSVWFDEELPANRVYADVISEQLDEAKAVLVLWSNEAAASQWVRSEANRAREMGTLIQAQLDDTRLPLPFDQIQCLDLRNWRGSKSAPGLRRLVGGIEAIVGAEGRAVARTRSGDQRIRGPLGRRAMLAGGGAAAAIAAAALFGWKRTSKIKASPEVELLVQKALAFMQDGRPEELTQSIAYLHEATRLEPRNAEALGLLAFVHVLRKYQMPGAGRPGEDARARSAARTALDLDRDEPFAASALVMLVPPYRNWVRTEALSRDLVRRFAFLPLSLNLLADALADVGRWRDAAAVQAKVDRRRHLIPLSDRSAIQALWSSGQLQAAETMLEGAVDRWPRHEAIWNLRVRFLTHTGRADEVVRLLGNSAAHPFGFSEVMLSSALATARALSGSGNRAEAARENLRMLDGGPPDFLLYLNRKVATAQLAAERFAALGDHEMAIALLEGYYFGRGPWARLAPQAGDEDRSTPSLFEPPMSSLWREPGFAALIEEIGLEKYWSATSRAPDFRSPQRTICSLLVLHEQTVYKLCFTGQPGGARLT